MDQLQHPENDVLDPMATLALAKSSPTSTTSDEGGVAVPPTTHPSIITINVGGRKFQTSIDTLRDGSGLLHKQLSPGWNWQPQPDGSYFLDADPDLFEHLLRFMRRPETFPIFYTKADGYNYDLYNRLEAEALYYQMDDLYEWLKAKKYLQAFKTEIGTPIIHNISLTSPFMPAVKDDDEMHVASCTRKVYLCPRQILAHRGRADQCGQACHRRQAENDVVYEDEPYWQIMTVKKDVVFDGKVCRTT